MLRLFLIISLSLFWGCSETDIVFAQRVLYAPKLEELASEVYISMAAETGRVWKEIRAADPYQTEQLQA